MNRFLTFYYQRIKPEFLDNPLYSEISENPFFILSSGRSGSTLLRKLLLQNSSTNIPPESDDLIPKLIKFYLRNNHISWDNIVNGSIKIFENEEATKLWNVNIDYDTFSKHSKDKSLAGIISTFYNLYAQTHNFERTHWGDKTPFLIFRLSWINLLYPNAKFLFLIRDGRAVVNSYLKMNKEYTLESASKRWKDSISIIRERLQRKPSNTLLIKYEDLIHDPQYTLMQVNEFLKISPIINTEKKIFMGDDHLIHHKNIHKDISDVYIDKWRHELSQEEIRFITREISTELKEFNYID